MGVLAKKARLAAIEIESDRRWAYVVDRDRNADGTFYYAVKTTGVYCRPSCPARHPRPENVRFYTNRAAAESDGFRPCKRCKPDQPPMAERNAATVARACRIIERSETTIKLDELARRVGVSPYHFHRMFRTVTGLTPRQYSAGHRALCVRKKLDHANSITDAIIDAGYNSNSRFYERANDVLGMTPSNYRAGGANTAIHFAVGECSLGSILVAQSERGVCAILLGDDPDELARDLQDRFPHAELIGGDRAFEALVAKVVGFVEAPAIGIDLPLDLRGTAFQQRVWQALREIPVGETRSYAEISQRIGAPRAMRAVAQACGANPLAVAIPCHRVVRSDGALSGYRWGVERKRALLEKESTV